MKKIYILMLISLSEILFSQQQDYSVYYKLRQNYENYPENDQRAFSYLRKYIRLAKKQNDSDHLVQGYKDGIFFSPLKEDKLKYSDSAISAAVLSKNNDLISNAYLWKGIIYYFNYKQYKSALNEYLKAYEYSKNSKDDFLKNGILYHIGVVKSYLGYYQEALNHFEEAKTNFKLKSEENVHPNLIYNNKKGYYNSLHRVIVCYRNLHNYTMIDSLISTGISQTQNNKEFDQEYGYFLKERGIEEYRKKRFPNAIKSLQTSLRPITHINDFAWATVNYFYIGKSYMEMNDPSNAIIYFQKVDSVFKKQTFILPELRENYELLINYYKANNNNDRELYYTKQLLKADSVMSGDFSYLSSKVHKEFDTKTLTEEKERLEDAASKGFWIIIGLITFALILLLVLIIKYKSEKRARARYKILEEKILNSNLQLTVKKDSPKLKEDEKIVINENIVHDLMIKLQEFEEKSGYIESGLTLHKLARKFNTNSNYLSQVVNESKGMNFNRYLSELRINYITNKLYNDKVYLNYKIETLAEKCGIASRTNFSNLFQEINGMRPKDFIKKRNEDLKNNFGS
ncbi:AraC family transcriptional regulator [uncultured Chryseobacterium sp.]|uniref:helix-turn-helix domain-containing protein n=1 Tax=uncultured Chryseobacterium sp. TaxID=259322 RepID=UPI0025E2D15B|nr:AraC family transcriptional regulator [uncultured Chryseobacterium sp.]